MQMKASHRTDPGRGAYSRGSGSEGNAEALRRFAGFRQAPQRLEGAGGHGDTLHGVNVGEVAVVRMSEGLADRSMTESNRERGTPALSS